jgi:hypothetical protein
MLFLTTVFVERTAVYKPCSIGKLFTILAIVLVIELNAMNSKQFTNGTRLLTFPMAPFIKFEAIYMLAEIVKNVGLSPRQFVSYLENPCKH